MPACRIGWVMGEITPQYHVKPYSRSHHELHTAMGNWLINPTLIWTWFYSKLWDSLYQRCTHSYRIFCPAHRYPTRNQEGMFQTPLPTTFTPMECVLASVIPRKNSPNVLLLWIQWHIISLRITSKILHQRLLLLHENGCSIYNQSRSWCHLLQCTRSMFLLKHPQLPRTSTTQNTDDPNR